MALARCRMPDAPQATACVWRPLPGELTGGSLTGAGSAAGLASCAPRLPQSTLTLRGSLTRSLPRSGYHWDCSFDFLPVHGGPLGELGELLSSQHRWLYNPGLHRALHSLELNSPQVMTSSVNHFQARAAGRPKMGLYTGFLVCSHIYF